MKAGDVLVLWCPFTRPRPKNKYVICIDPAEGLHLFINSRPLIDHRASVLVTRQELPCLAYDSYVHTAELMLIDPDDAAEQVQREPWREKGRIDLPVRRKIKNSVEGHDLLTPIQLRKILENL